MEKPLPDDIKKFREFLLDKLRSNLFNFDSYFSSEQYRLDIQNDLSITLDSLLNRGIEILISSLHEIGIFISNNDFINNFYDCDICVDIYSFLQPNNLISLLLSLKYNNFEIINDIENIIDIEIDQVENKLYDFFNIISIYNNSPEIDKYKMFISDYLYSNNTFYIYIKNILHIINFANEQEDIDKNINEWIKYIVNLKNIIFDNEDISSDYIYNNLIKWLSSLLHISCSYLILKYLKNNNSLNDIQKDIISLSYSDFKKKTVGYLVYYNSRDIKITNEIEKLMDIINRYDIIYSILEKK